MMRRLPHALVFAVALALSALLFHGPSEARAAGKTLTLAIWSNYMPEEVLRGFEKEQGCTVDVPWNYSSNDELLAKLQGKDTGFDLAVPSDVVLPVLISQGLLEPLDPQKLPNASHLDPAFTKRASDPEGKWSVPYTWGTVGLAWRTDKVKGAVDSWGVLADPAFVGGNAYLLEEARDVVAAALLFHGKDINSTDPKDLAQAKATLLSWRKGIKGFTGEVKDHLLTGEAWLIQAYNGDVAQAMKEKPGQFAFAVPKEGGILWVDNFVIPKGAPEKALALAFIDYVLRPEVAARISMGIRYALPNKDAVPLVDAAIRNDPVIYAPEDVRKRLQQERDLGGALKKITDLWTEVRAGR